MRVLARDYHLVKSYVWRADECRYDELTYRSTRPYGKEYTTPDGATVCLIDLIYNGEVVKFAKINNGAFTFDGVNSDYANGMAYDVISISDCAKYLNRTVQGVHYLIGAGKLVTQKLGRTTYISGESARALHKDLYGRI